MKICKPVLPRSLSLLRIARTVFSTTVITVTFISLVGSVGETASKNPWSS